MSRSFQVGVIVLIGRGTAGQLLIAIVLAGGFVAMHIRSWPYKQVADNALKMTVEIQIFCTIAVGLAMKADADKSASTTAYDIFLVTLFVANVPVVPIRLVHKRLLQIIVSTS